MLFSSFIAQLVAALVFGGGLLMWARIAGRLKRHEPIMLRQWDYPVPWDGIDVLLVVAAYFIALVVCIWLAMRTFGIHGPIDPSRFDPQLDLAVLSGNLAASVEIFVIALCVLRLRAGASLTEMGFDLRYFADDIGTGLCAFLAAAPVVYGIQLVLVEVVGIKYEHPLMNAVNQAPSSLMLIIASVSAVIVAPLVEEFLFRVVLQGWLEKLELRAVYQPEPAVEVFDPSQQNTPIVMQSSDASQIPPVPPNLRGLYGLPLGTIPILFSSTLFAVVHWGQGAAPIPLFVLALVLGFVYQRTHRFIPSVTVHMALNGVSMLMFFLSPLNNW